MGLVGRAGFGIDISINVDGVANLEAANDALAETQQNAKGVSGNLNQVSSMAKKTGAVMVGMGAAIAAPLVMGTKMAIGFNQSMTLLSAIDPSANIKELGDAIVKAAAPVPASAQDMADMAIVAAKMGVQGKDAIIAFAQSAIMLQASTDIMGEDAANALSRINDTFQTSVKFGGDLQKAINAIGSSLISLDSASKASASEIVDVTLRATQATKAFGLSEGETMAVGATLLDMGVSAETAGTNLGKVLNTILIGRDKISKFVASQKLMVDGTRLTARGFNDMLTNNPAKALTTLSSALAQVNPQLRPQVLADLGINGQGAIRVMGGLADATRRAAVGQTEFNMENNALVAMMQTGNSEFAKGTAMGERYAIMMQSTAAKIDIVKGSLETFLQQMGNFFLPIIGRVLDMGAKLLDWLINLPEPVKKAIAYFMTFASVALIIGGLALIFVGVVAGIMATVAAAGGLAAVFAGIGGVVAAIGSTLAWFIGIVAGVAAIGYVLWNVFGTVLKQAFADLMPTIMAVWDALGLLWAKITGGVSTGQTLINIFKAIAGAVWTLVGPILQLGMIILSYVVMSLQTAIATISGLINFVYNMVVAIAALASGFISLRDFVNLCLISLMEFGIKIVKVLLTPLQKLLDTLAAVGVMGQKDILSGVDNMVKGLEYEREQILKTQEQEKAAAVSAQPTVPGAPAPAGVKPAPVAGVPATAPTAPTAPATGAAAPPIATVAPAGAVGVRVPPPGAMPGKGFKATVEVKNANTLKVESTVKMDSYVFGKAVKEITNELIDRRLAAVTQE